MRVGLETIGANNPRTQILFKFDPYGDCGGRCNQSRTSRVHAVSSGLLLIITESCGGTAGFSPRSVEVKFILSNDSALFLATSAERFVEMRATVDPMG